MLLQQQAVQQNLFDPYWYFGALEMPEIPAEDEPSHRLIEQVFPKREKQTQPKPLPPYHRQAIFNY